MTENDRVRQLRKELNLTMDKFGGRMGVTKTSISMIESGKRALTNQMRHLICKEFHVREEWLRDGSGEMFVVMSEKDSIAFFVEELMREEKDSFKLRLIDALSKLDDEEWRVLGDLAKRLSEEE